ncbi:MAG: hypothetical protein AB2598_20425 [Candidatus Thiodiazotropha sp.]
MSKNYAYDLLIFTARPEEIWFLKKFFFLEENGELLESVADPILGVFQVVKYNGISICLICLEKMGNVNSALIAYKTFTRSLPKAVVMTGLSAAVPKDLSGKNGLELGDVGISNSVKYYSFGKKIAGKNFPVIRDTRESRTLLKIDDIKVFVGNGVGFRNSVNERVDAWWESGNFSHDEWIKDSVDVEDQEDYQDQYSPSNVRDERSDKMPLKVETNVRYASGEYVVADKRFVSQIKKDFGGTNPVRMIDMESYGMSIACEEFNIPYLTIKGVSDYAGQEKSDHYRWVSIAAASATCIELIDKGFAQSEFSIKPYRPNTNAACLIPMVEPPCPQTIELAQAGDWRRRPCLDIAIKNIPSDGIVGDLSRVHEDVLPRTYSHDISEYLKSIDGTEKITFIFPYDPYDLLEFFQKEISGKETLALVTKAKQLMKVIAAPTGGFTDEMVLEFVSTIKQLGTRIRRHYQHFGTADTIAKNDSKTNILDARVKRIIVFEDGSEIDEDSISSNLTNIIYPLVLGRNIPTYCTTTDILGGYNCPFPDAVYIEKVASEDISPHTVLRYNENSRALIISGVPCQTVPSDLGEISKNLGVHKLYKYWRSWASYADNGELGQDFAIFPTKAILDRYAGG